MGQHRSNRIAMSAARGEDPHGLKKVEVFFVRQNGQRGQVALTPNEQGEIAQRIVSLHFKYGGVRIVNHSDVAHVAREVLDAAADELDGTAKIKSPLLLQVLRRLAMRQPILNANGVEADPEAMADLKPETPPAAPIEPESKPEKRKGLLGRFGIGKASKKHIRFFGRNGVHWTYRELTGLEEPTVSASGLRELAEDWIGLHGEDNLTYELVDG